ncbi:hypothetical protein DM01DRAFT_1210582 [Hesseltinella vesiculosa]|uniref:Uncharacterized protein n=1 Tax=Hesseltinella vesiculosa TaxID=101127 RepID=A0A1X2GQH9_9FUNG|nr:hypothetical protein DM01DRAFT_1210582 [Hesseltinella vesiculosa]
MSNSPAFRFSSRHSLTLPFFVLIFFFQIGKCAFHPSSWVKVCNCYSIALKIGLSPTKYIIYLPFQRKVVGSPRSKSRCFYKSKLGHLVKAPSSGPPIKIPAQQFFFTPPSTLVSKVSLQGHSTGLQELGLVITTMHGVLLIVENRFLINQQQHNKIP